MISKRSASNKYRPNHTHRKKRCFRPRGLSPLLAEQLEPRLLLTARISGDWGWAAAIGAGASDVATDAHGNVYLAGGFSGSPSNLICDFDPGPAQYTVQATSSSSEYSNAFLAKYTPLGEFVWVRALSIAWGSTTLREIEIASDGSVRALVTARNQHVWSTSSLQIYAPEDRAELLSDVGPGQTLGFVCSFSSDGLFQWISSLPREATTFTAPSLNRATDAFYVAFDSEYLYRVNATGVLESTPLPFRRLSDLGGTAGRLLFNHVGTDIYGNLFFAGTLRGGADFDPSPNTYELYSSFEWGWNSGRTQQICHWSDDVFLAKYTPAGSLEWVQLQGVSTKHETLEHLAIDPGGTTAIAASNSIYNSNQIISTFTPNGSLIWSTEVSFDTSMVRLCGLAYDAAAKLVLLTQNGFVDIDQSNTPTLNWRDRIYDGYLDGGHYDGFGRAVVWGNTPIRYGNPPPRSTRMNSSGLFPVAVPGSYFAILTEVNVPPVAVGLSLSTITLPENTPVPSRRKLADIEIYDDPRGVNHYTLTGPDAAFFEIDGAALYLRPDLELDYERKPVYDVTVSAADPSLLQSQPVTTSFQLTLSNVNEAPTDISLATASVPENLVPGTTVGGLVAADEDIEDTIVFTLVAGDGDIDNAAFRIVGSQLQTALRFDYEARAAHSVRVRATDASGAWVEESFEISIADVEDLDFESLPIAAGGTFFQAIAAVDCDGDSDIDLIATIVEPGSASRKNSLAWYENDGTGTFSEHVIASGLAYSQEIVCADLDGDGRLDIAVTEQDAGSIRIYVGSPDGFTLLSVISGVPNVVGLATVDFDHDGDEDLVSISHWSGAVRLHTNNGSDGFSTTTISSAEYGRHIECADLDQDGDVDLIVAEQYVADANRRNQDLRTTLLINSGSGTFTKHYLRGGEVAAMAADVDGDGILDIISRNVTNVFLHRGIAGGGYETHQVASDTMTGGMNSWSVELALADLDGDTRLDVITGMKVDGVERTAVYRQKSDGTFFPEYTLVPPVAAVADFDGDGIYDIVGGALGGPLVFGRSTLNAPPRDITLAQTFVAENLAAGTALSLLTTDDPDAGDTFTYNLVAGSGDTDNSLFAVAGDTLLSAAPLNFEDGRSYSIRLRSTDAGGLATEKTFVFNVLDVNEAPTALSLTNPVTFLPEDTVTTSRIKVADIVVTDDALGTNSLMISGADAASFEIDGVAIYLKAGTLLDFEAKTAYAVTVGVADDAVPDSTAITIDYVLVVSNVNESPTLISLGPSAVAENSQAGTVVGSLSTIDVDAGDTFTYTLVSGTGDTDNVAFMIEGSALKTVASFDFEAQSTHSIRVRSTDSGGLATEQLVSISIGDVNEAPTGLTLASVTLSVPENTPTTSRIKVADIVVTDDALGINSLSLAGADSVNFEIDGTVLYLKAGTALDFEGQNAHSVTVRVQDSTVAGSSALSANYGLAIRDVNEAPTAISLTNAVTSLPEDTGTTSRIKIADIVITDDALGTNSFSLSGADAASFEIDGLALYVKAGTLLDFEARNAYSLTVRVQDSSVASSPALMTSHNLAITDVNEAPTAISLTNTATSLPEDTVTTSRIKVADIVITDDALGTNSLSLSGADATSFQIDGLALYLKGGTLLNFEAKSSYSVTVRVQDLTAGGSPALTVGYGLTITNVNEPPTRITLSATSIAENNDANSVVGTLATADPDAGDNFTYTFVAGIGDTANAAFMIAGSDLRTAASFNFEAQSSYSIRIRSMDTGGLFIEQVFTVLVNDVNEGPTGLTFANVTTSLPENAATTSRIKVADIVVTDDAIGTNSISLSGADAASFEIDGLALYVKAGTALNFEARNAYSMTVHVQDSTVTGSPALTANYGFTITDVNEAPTAVSITNTVTSLPENAGTTSRIKVADIVVTDDAIGTNSILLSGDDAGSFQIDGLALYLKAGTDLNFEAKHAYSVTVTVQDMAVAGSSALTDTYGLAITDVNEAPTALSLTNVAASLPENTATTSRIKVADIVITDDALGTNTLSLTGADADSFQIDGLSLYLKADTVLNFEAKTSYFATVIAQDTTLSGSAALTTNYALAITDVSEAPAAPRTSAPAFFTVVEDTPTALVFAAAPFSDSDSKLTKTMTVTLTIPAGSLAATSAVGVTVAGTTTARTFTGSLSNLNAYFTASPGRVIYTPARDSTATIPLSIAIAEKHGGRTLTSRSASRLQIVAVNDAPVVFVPARFVVREDTRTNLLWPASPTGFTDIDSPSLSVTVSAPDGSLFAATAGGVTVTGTPTARILTGSPTALKAYFKTLGRVAYLPALDNTAPRTLTTTVTDGVDTRVATSTIAITPVNDAPRILSAAVINGSAPSTPVEISYDTLRTATNATDAEVPNPSLVIQTVLTGTLQRWNGSAWVRVSTTAGSPLGQRTLQPGQRLRWIPPSGSTGLQNAFRVTASDGVASSAGACTVRISVG